MATIDDILAWTWPEERREQGVAMTLLNTLLTTLTGEWQTRTQSMAQVNKDTEPTLTDWQAAWTTSGKALPIREGAKLYWYAPVHSKLMGVYAYLDGGVVRLTLSAPQGGVGLVPFGDAGDTVTATGSGVATLNSISFRFKLSRAAKLYINVPMTLINGGGATETHRVGYKYDIDSVGFLDAISTPSGVQFQNTSCAVTPTSDMHTQIFRWLHPNTLSAGEHTLRFYGVRLGTATVNTFHAFLQVPYSASVIDANAKILAATQQAVTLEAVYV